MQTPIAYAVEAVASAADGQSLAATRRLGAAALAAAALPPEQQLAAVLQLAAVNPADTVETQAFNAASSDQRQWVLAAVAIELLLSGHSSATADQVAGVLRHQVLPLLTSDAAGTTMPPAAAGAAVSQQQQQEELLAAAAQLVARCDCWNLGLELVRAAAASSAGEPSSISSSPAADASITSQLPVHMRVRLAAAVIQQALETAGQQEGEAEAELQDLLHHAATNTLEDALSLLASEPTVQRRQRSKGGPAPTARLAAGATRAAAAQLLFPAALQAAARQQGHTAAMEQLWEACERMLEGSRQQRQQGLALLVQFAAPLLSATAAASSGSNTDPPPQQQWRGLQEQPAFWELLRGCLCDSEASSRKRAAHLLRLALQAQHAAGQVPPAWQPLLKLLDCLEELTPHLVKDAWGEIDRLHPPAAAPDDGSGNNAGASGSGEGSLDWSWMEVVWTRGLAHDHQQVQRMVLASFLGRHWEPAQLAAVPRAFVLHTLLPAAGQVHLWRGEGAEELQHDVAAWVGRYAAAQAAQEQQQLLLAMLGLLAADGGGSTGGSGAAVQQRPLVQTVVAALGAAAQAQTARADGGAGAGGLEAGWQWQLLLLGRLQEATCQLSSSWGSGGPTGSYAVSTCGSLLPVAASTGRLHPDGHGSSHTALATAATWLQQLPLPLLLPGGSLHAPAVDWLGSAGRQQLLPALTACAQRFMEQGDSGGSSSSGAGAPADLVAEANQASGQQQAGGLARLALLLTCSGSHTGSAPVLTEADLATAFASWDATLGSLYRRPYLQPGAAERCLLLLNELLATAQLLVEQIRGQQRQQQPPLVDWLAAAIGSGADELASYASMAAAPLWQQPQQLAAGEEGRQQGAAALPALAGVCNSLRLLVQLESGARPASEQLISCCLGALQSYAATADTPAAAGQHPAAGTADSSAWQQAAAPLQPLADCCSALAAAAEVGWLNTAEQQLGGAAAGEAASQAAAAALNAVLLLQASAAEAAAASGASKQAGGLAAYCHRLCWKAAHNLLLLLRHMHSSPSLHGQQRQQWDDQQVAALATALTGLQRASHAPALAADYRGLLLQLRCARLLLPDALQQPGLAQRVLACQPEPAAQPAISHSSTEPTVALAAWLCSAAWQGYEAAAAAAKRRRAGLTAAVVSTCLHPALFGVAVSGSSSPAVPAAAAAAALHGPEGPIQQLLRRLLDQGTKSWRTMGIVSLQLCGVLARHPELASHYGAALQVLLLWGAADDPGLSGVGDPVDVEAAAELASLLAPGDVQLSSAFASSSLAPRVAALCLLHSWVQCVQRTGADDPATGQRQAPAAAGEAGRQMWRQLLELALQNAELSAARYNALGAIHRKKVRLWQALCVLSPLVPAHEADAALDSLLPLMAATADAANVRQYQDSIVLVLLRLRPDLLRTRVLPPLADCSSSGSHALSSLILIAARAAVAQLAPAGQAAAIGDQQTPIGAAGEQQRQQQLTEEQQTLLSEVVAAVAPWALCHVHALRTFAQLVLWRLFELFPSLPARDATAAALLHFFRDNDDINRLRRGLSHAFYFDAYQLDEAVTPAGVLGQAGSKQRGEAGFEGAPEPLLEVIQGFLAIERHALRQDMKQREAATAAAELAPLAHQQQPPPQQQGGAQIGGSNWQKKGGGAALAGPAAAAAAAGPWAEALGSGALLAAAAGGSGLDGTDLELGAAEAAAAAARGGPRQELVVVASLLTKPPNLAGLARTCEVFRASSLVLGDLSVTRQKEFTTIAVTAHHWVPLQEVPEAALAPWLRRQAVNGWALVGLEQTAESVPLQDFEFPRRTVLVLGREREGIPADILALLHHTVEIPQLGLIRSLNVHVSGAIGMYEYTRQALQAAQAGPPVQQATSG